MPKAKPERPTSPPGEAPVDDAAPKCPTECTITSETVATFPRGDFPCEGSITFSIPWEFRVGADGPAKVFTIVEQVATFTSTGRATVEKAGAQVSSNLDDPSVEDPIFE